VASRTTDRKIERALDWIVGFQQQRIDLIKPTGTRISDMPLPVLICFLYIASHDGCNSQDMAKDTGMTPAAVSRNTDWLCAKRNLSEPGMHLITKRTDPCNKRFKVLQLTQLGKDQVKLFHLMNG
jgi:DNA-binding MarR family transcriptional regulator